MFTLLQGDIEKRPIIEIPVSELSDVLDTLLRLVYPPTYHRRTVLEARLCYYHRLPSKTSHFFTTLFTNIAYLFICVSFLV